MIENNAVILSPKNPACLWTRILSGFTTEVPIPNKIHIPNKNYKYHKNWTDHKKRES